ncbi:hypothetical protein MKQ70_09255 [Chitinophaga sedimenti]|uniref:hypothetical protein n=1 Tax=Chitinophaga sedimenti TaxID=2033606 RepID=UPI002004246D|nr:hypothetical protein [Chitinophaga sedimenti]MCK7555182.1 hypothetical protein [Chitinophaga sedimenti]
MAILTSIIKFTGALDNLIGYQVNGKTRVRSRPQQVRQTLNTKRAAKDFGSASRTAAVLRHGIIKDITVREDNEFVNRLNKAMVGVIKTDLARPAGRRRVTTGSLRAPEGFRVNKYMDINCGYAVQRVHDGSLQVTITQPLAQFRDKVQHMQFRAIAVYPDFERGKTLQTTSEIVVLSKVQASDIRAFCLTIPAPHPGEAIVLLEAIACTMEKGQPVHMGYRNYNAANIIAIVPAAKKNVPGVSASGFF